MFESLIRKWLRGRASDGFEEVLEYYIRDAVKSFSYVEMPLFMQLVRNIAGDTLGEPSALCILSGCINGQRAFQDHKTCSTCGEECKDLKRCTKCKMAQYCNVRCQKLHWPIHKKFCDDLKREYIKLQKQQEEESQESQKTEDRNQGESERTEIKSEDKVDHKNSKADAEQLASKAKDVVIE